MADCVFRHHLRVTYAHCTIGNHVYYARYLDILEAARGEFFRNMGRSCLNLQQSDITFPVIGLELSYKAPARYDDLLTIELWLAELKGARLSFASRILNQHGTLLLEGQTRHACASQDEKPKRIPAELVACMQPFLHQPAS